MTVAVVVTVVSLKLSKPKYLLLQEGLLTYSPQMWDGCFSSAPMIHCSHIGVATVQHIVIIESVFPTGP